MEVITEDTQSLQKSLRILFVSEYFYPRAAGGEVWSWELCRELVRMGHSVTVVTTRIASDSLDETVLGVRIVRPVQSLVATESRMRRYLANRKLSVWIRRYLKQNPDFDIVHVMAYGVNVATTRAAASLGIPCVTSVHSFFGKHWSLIMARDSTTLPRRGIRAMSAGFLRAMERSNLKQDTSTKIHVPSRYLATLMANETGRNPVVIHNWLPPKLPAPREFPEQTLVFVGSLEAVKNPLACIDVARQVGAPLVVIGAGSLERDMHERARRLGVRLTLIERMDHHETLRYLGGASLVLVPSVTESFSLVALEAIAQGTPVAGTPVGVLPDLPGVVPWPPARIPPRIADSAQAEIRARFDRSRLLQEMLSLYQSAIRATHLPETDRRATSTERPMLKKGESMRREAGGAKHAQLAQHAKKARRA
jgi:glycosyltransferase involved in cell wall biosynthesis